MSESSIWFATKWTAAIVAIVFSFTLLEATFILSQVQQIKENHLLTTPYVPSPQEILTNKVLSLEEEIVNLKVNHQRLLDTLGYVEFTTPGHGMTSGVGKDGWQEGYLIPEKTELTKDKTKVEWVKLRCECTQSYTQIRSRGLLLECNGYWYTAQEKNRCRELEAKLFGE